jgi:hypothetical protein
MCTVVELRHSATLPALVALVFLEIGSHCFAQACLDHHPPILPWDDRQMSLGLLVEMGPLKLFA